MTLKNRIVRGSLAAIAVLGFLGFGCSRQAEGQRCDMHNINDDCQDGLVCTSKNDVHLLSDICCPPSGATDPACNPLANIGGGGGDAQGSATASASSVGTGGGGGAGGAGGAGGGAASTCVPGNQVECACVAGAKGFQVCAKDGLSFGACNCEGVSASSSAASSSASASSASASSSSAASTSSASGVGGGV